MSWGHMGAVALEGEVGSLSPGRALPGPYLVFSARFSCLGFVLGGLHQ